MGAAGISELSQLAIGISYVSFGYSNLLHEAYLLILGGHVLVPRLVKLADLHVNLLAVLSYLVQAVGFELLLLEL